jgi:hypothetical protein
VQKPLILKGCFNSDFYRIGFFCLDTKEPKDQASFLLPIPLAFSVPTAILIRRFSLPGFVLLRRPR